jgi:hypothetical protein
VSQKFPYKLLCDPTPCREVIFQAAIKLIRSHLDGTIRPIVSSGSPIRFNSPTSMLLCACPPMNTGTMGGSFKMRKRRETGNDYAKRGQ